MTDTHDRAGASGPAATRARSFGVRALRRIDSIRVTAEGSTDEH